MAITSEHVGTIIMEHSRTMVKHAVSVLDGDHD